MKAKYVLSNFLIDVLLNTFIITSVEIVKRNVCLDKALSFATKYDYDSNPWSRCKSFTESNALTFFGEGSASCNTGCQININFNYMYQYWNTLGFVSIVFESYNYSANTGCNNGAELHIDCSNYRKDQLGIFFNSDCNERNSKCSRWNKFCVCLCDQGYLMYYGHCIRESTTDNVGPILGALLGGLLLGVIISLGTVFLIYRRSLYKRKESAVMFAVNATHGDVSDDDTNQNKASTNQNKIKQKKVNSVSPINRSEESPQYSKSSGKQSTVPDKDDVYNHLNEKRESEDENIYDHACAAAGKGHKDLDDYGNLHGMDDDIVVLGGTDIDDYSTLAHN